MWLLTNSFTKTDTPVEYVSSENEVQYVYPGQVMYNECTNHASTKLSIELKIRSVFCSRNMEKENINRTLGKLLSDAHAES